MGVKSFVIQWYDVCILTIMSTVNRNSVLASCIVQSLTVIGLMSRILERFIRSKIKLKMTLKNTKH